MEIVTVQRVGIISTGQLERRETRVNFGPFCNNDGRHYVRELLECPADIALSVKTDGKPIQVSELDWMKRRV